MTEDQPVLCEDHGAIRLLTLNRPAKKNAFSPQMARLLTELLSSAAEDDAVRVVVVTGAGDTFSAGVDVSVFLRAGEGDAAGVGDLTALHETLRSFPKPLIAAVQGKAVGMGVTLLPHFDMVYAAKGATFLTPFVRLGLVLEYGSSYTLPRLIGRQRANELILRAKPVDAQVAEAWGLVTRTFASDELMAAVLEVAGEIASCPPGAVMESKRLIQQGEEAAFQESVERENEVLQKRYGSPENVEAVTAFLSRKKG
ncbi:MAG: enoyl-CoA hydratase/isomerase family protein [Myxococcota bacterium]